MKIKKRKIVCNILKICIGVLVLGAVLAQTPDVEAESGSKVREPGKESYIYLDPVGFGSSENGQLQGPSPDKDLLKGDDQKPDLVIQAKDEPFNPDMDACGIIPYTGGKSQVGKRSKVWFNLYNFGRKPVKDAVIKVYLQGNLLKELTVPYLDKESYQNLELVWVPQQAGLNDVFIVADPDNSLSEVDKNNNSIRIKEDVEEPDYDWAVTSFKYDPDNPEMGQDVKMFIEVFNKGKSKNTVSLDVYLDQDKIGKISVNTEPGKREVFGDGVPEGDAITWQAKSGIHTLEAVLNPGDYEDYNLGDNRITKEIDVHSEFDPVSGTDFILEKDNIKFDGKKLYFRVYNRGNTPDTATVECRILYLDNGRLFEDVVPLKPVFIPGQGYHDFSIKLDKEDFKVNLTVDQHQDVVEAREDNNQADYVHGGFREKLIPVIQEDAEGPLIIKGFTGMQSALDLGQSREIGAYFKNISQGRLRNIKSKMQVVSVDTKRSSFEYGGVERNTFIFSVEPEGEFEVGFPYKAVYPGLFKIIFQVSALDQDNRTRYLRKAGYFTVRKTGRLPDIYYFENKVDLSLYPEDFFIIPETVDYQDSVCLEFKIRNQSPIDIEDAEVLVKFGKEKKFFKIIPLLESGEAQVFRVNYKPETTGLISVYAAVDPYNKIVETNDTNNRVDRVLKVVSLEERLQKSVQDKIKRDFQSKEKKVVDQIKEIREDVERTMDKDDINIEGILE